MATLAELQARRDALAEARYSGQRKVKTGNTEIEFKTDAEIKAALDDLDREISAASNASTPAFIVFNTSKGY